MMKPDNRAFLEKHSYQWFTLKNAGFVGMFDSITCQELIRIVREEWQPNYIGNCWCDACREELIRFAYTQMEKEPVLIEAAPIEEPKPKTWNPFKKK